MGRLDEKVGLGRLFRAYEECGGLFLARIDARGKPMLLSSAWETVLGYSRNELSAMTLAALTHPTDLQMLARLREGCGGPEMPPVHWTLQRRDGSAVPCRWYRRLDRYDESLFIVGDAISGPP